MALEVREEAQPPPTTPEQEAMKKRADELREWLLHLEGWIDKQLVATQALVALLADGREGEGATHLRGGEQ